MGDSKNLLNVPRTIINIKYFYYALMDYKWIENDARVLYINEMSIVISRVRAGRN